MNRGKKDAPQPEYLSVGALLQKIAHEEGIGLLLEPRWKVAGQITSASGKRRYFRSMSLDLNTQGAATISTDKDYAAYFLQSMGYSVSEGRAFFSADWGKTIGSKDTLRAALVYAKKLGYPVIAKPNSKSQGRGVTLAHTPRELERALKAIFKYDRVALVQRRAIGRDYRIVVLDGTIISAYERRPLSVLGDGRSSIKKLLSTKQKYFSEIGRDTVIDLADPRIKAKLALQRRTLASTPKAGERVQLLDNANLSAGGDAVDVTEILHEKWRSLAAKIAADMNLRLSGIDIMTQSPLSEPPHDYTILEVNDSPGLDHYAAIGPAQKKIVEDLYRAVLIAMAKN